MSGQHQTASRYFVPAPSRYPVLASTGLLVILASAAGWVNGLSFAPWTFTVGMLGLLLVLRGWFADAIGESEGGHYGRNVDVSYRWSMSWFIFSEVMFFAAFFGALFYARNFALPQLAGLDAKLLWPDFTAVWPTLGPAGTVDKFGTMGPWPIPTLNTALLLSSGVTITIAHHALRANQRARAAFWLFLTICLGVTFLGFQGFEYFHAYHELNMKLTSGIYGSTFFLLTGFHGFHVMMGTVMLSVMLIRILKGHFTPEHHFGFEGAAWYWHFVDVVWLGLYVVVYWL
ncbi:MFS transporter [Pandoraea thiooxydans]|uniref:cytochrome-c oxidase n=1 Tax=Pandoraea thiooxydans TaxID=445709 RepID=A0A0G3ET81_9BURK|nr:cytochrome c oxidase subunit 3 [Pandoraea thiooxydans]AKJ69239.1 MFS transporter [Pandoraea thiooxydans]APR96843.1 MFS transporter [Pandoraea thiooxydans]